MIVTNQIKMDLLENGCVPVIGAVQNDRYCRNLELALFCGTEGWAVPEGAEIIVRYSKADGTGGEYDTLPDGSIAWSALENVLTVALAPQVLTAPGPVKLSVSVCVGDAQVTTFAVMLNVQAQVGAEVTESGDYYCVPRFVPAPESAQVGQFFRVAKVDGQGRAARVEAVDIVEGREAVLFTPQVLTEEQRSQARENIGAVTASEVIAELEGSAEPVDLLAGAAWEAGYLSSGGVLNGLSACQNGEVTMTAPVAVAPGGTYSIRNVTTNGEYAWLAYGEYDENGGFLRRVAFDAYYGQFPEGVQADGKTVYTLPVTLSEDAYGLRVSGRTFLFNAYNGTATQEQVTEALTTAGEIFQLYEDAGTSSRLLPEVTDADAGKQLVVQKGGWKAVRPKEVFRNGNIRSVNHRGYHTAAPENTLAAFRLSKKMGFDYVEADVSFTGDGYAVLLHDETVDRTSNGTGSIGELTLEYVRSLDFGSWKSQDYAGERIPTFEEFLALCRRLGLHPYIEIKPPVTQAQVEGLVAVVKRYGMADKVTWITAAGTEYLGYVQNAHSGARLGLVCERVTETAVTAVMDLKKECNGVFLDTISTNLTEEMVQLCAEKEIPVEVWDLWSEEQVLAADSYISGFTTDAVIAGEVLCGVELV